MRRLLMIVIVLIQAVLSVSPQSVKSDSLFALGIDLYNAGKYKDAIPSFQECIKLDDVILSPYNKRREYSRMWLASCYAQQGDSTKAMTISEFYKKPVDRRLTVKSDSLANLGELIYEEAKYEDEFKMALNYFRQTFEVERNVLGEQHPWYINSIIQYTNKLFELIRYYNNNVGLNKTSEANRLGAEAYQLLSRIPDNDNTHYTEVLCFLTIYNYRVGNYPEAVQYGEKAIQIMEKSLDREDKYATLLTFLADSNLKMGNYVKARDFGTKALQIMELYGKDNASYIAGLNVLASIYVELRDFDMALSLSKEALHILEESPDIDNSFFIIAYNNILVSNYEEGHYTEALKICTEARQLLERIPKNMFFQYAPTVINIAHYIFASGNIEEAISLVTEILDILEESPNMDRYSYMRALSFNAYFNFRKGNYDEALLWGDRALHISKTDFGENHPYYAFSLFEMAYFYSSLGNIPLIEKNVEASYDIYTHFIHNTFKDLTEYERSQLWGLYQNLFQVWAHNFSYHFPTATLLENSYNASLLCKNYLLSLSRSMSEIIQDSGDKEVLALYEELKDNRKALQMLYEKPISERHLNTDSLETIANQQERELIKKSKVYGDYVKNLDIQWKDVQRALGTNDVAIEFVSFPLNADSTMYIAYVLQKNMKHPELVPLFEENQLKNIMNAYGQNAYKAYEQKKVSELVWQPLSKYLKGKANIYFAPSGELYNIGIENMPHWRKGVLMSNKWKLYRLSSTRELAVVKDKTMMSQASVYGGINYETNVDTLEANSRKYSTKHNTIKIPYDLIASLRTRGFIDKLPHYLPATKEEAEKIHKYLEQNKITTKLTMGTEATESDFKNLSGKDFNLLHVASHGFYWTEREARKYDLPFLMLDNKRTRYVEDKALCRSGLFLAGAKNVLRGDSLPDGVDDGVLTAKEISEMDLRSIDMVVLSACQTGLGEIMGDGIFGLQRGFKKAGAKTILMSLWEVHDKATSLLMAQFYTYLTQGCERHEALWKAMMDVKEKYEEPYYWAGFVMLD